MYKWQFIFYIYNWCMLYADGVHWRATGVRCTVSVHSCSYHEAQRTQASVLGSAAGERSVVLCTAVYFNLFSVAEPFVAILIAHGTHVFFRGWTPEARRADIQGLGRVFQLQAVATGKAGLPMADSWKMDVKMVFLCVLCENSKAYGKLWVLSISLSISLYVSVNLYQWHHQDLVWGEARN